jgi:hypothetical protein
MGLLIDQNGNPLQVGKFENTAKQISITGTSARVQLDPLKVYRITSDIDCVFRQGAGSVVAVTTDHPLWSKTYDFLRTGVTDFWIAAISPGQTTGTFTASEIETGSLVVGNDSRGF